MKRMIVKSRLPIEYQEVECVLSGNNNATNRYVDTGYKPTNNTKVEFYIKQHNSTTAESWYARFFGVNKFRLTRNSSTNNIQIIFGNQTIDTGVWFNQTYVRKFTFSKDGLYIDDKFIAAVEDEEFTSNQNIWLFRDRAQTGTFRNAYIYNYFKIWENGVLVRHYVPCYRKSDNIVGFYDLVNKTFNRNTNTASGDFTTKGTNISPQLIPIKSMIVKDDELIPYKPMLAQELVKDLCFTLVSETVSIGCSITGSPTVDGLQYSTNGITWNTWDGSTLTLTNKLYFRNTNNSLNTFSSNVFKFTTSDNGLCDISGELASMNNHATLDTGTFYSLFENCSRIRSARYLIMPTSNGKNNTYRALFKGCSNLQYAPELPNYCFDGSSNAVVMFANCVNLITLPKLTNLGVNGYMYYEMFKGCSKIKLSETQEGEYQTPYRIPYSGTATGTVTANTMRNMFSNTGGTFTGTPVREKTYYTSNEVY